MLKLGTTGVSTTYKKAYLGDNLVYDGYAGIKTTPNTNNYILNNSADGKNKGNIKIGNGPELFQYTSTGKQLLDYDNMTQGIAPSVSDGQDSAISGNCASSGYIEVDNTQPCIIKGDSSSPAQYIFFYDSSKSYLGNKQLDSNTTYASTGYLISSNSKWQNTAYLRFRTDNFINTFGKHIMLEQSSTASNYEPYTNGQVAPSPSYPQNVGVASGNVKVIDNNQNLYNVDDINSQTKCTVDDDGWITATYDNTAGSGTVYSNFYTNNLKLKPNTQYMIVAEVKEYSGTFSSLSYCTNTATEGQFGVIGRITYSDLSGLTNTTNFDIKTTVDEPYLSAKTRGLRSTVAFGAGTSGSITYRISVLADLTVNASTFKYKPFSQKTFNVTLPEGMFLGSIGTASNYIYGKKDNWKLHSGVGKAVINGDEDWNIFGSGTANWFYYANIVSKIHAIQADGNNKAKCNYFKNAAVHANSTAVGFSLLSNSSITNLRIRGDVEETLQTYKTWLSTHNLIIYGQLYTPTDTAITDTTLITQLNNILDNLQTYKDQTTVFTTSENLEPNIQFDYRAK